MTCEAFCDRCALYSPRHAPGEITDMIGKNGREITIGNCQLNPDGVWSDGLCTMFVSLDETSVEVVFLRARVKELEERLKMTEAA